MSKKTLFQKIWEKHEVATLPDGRTQFFIDAHLLHEVTSPQAFGMLKKLNLPVKYPKRTFATVDHIIPTDNPCEPFADELANEMILAIRDNCAKNDIKFFDTNTGNQGVIHIVMPEQGIIHPGMTVACGDSHTATHGAFGAIAFGIGTSQVRDVLATGSLAFKPLKVRKIQVDGKLKDGVFAKDVALHIIRKLGVEGGIGFAYEFAGEVFDNMSMEERMTVCNMAIEGGARCGYVNPDEKTFEYLKSKPYAPKGDWNEVVKNWASYASDEGCEYDDVVVFNGEDIKPTFTWGINPAQAIFADENFPKVEDFKTKEEQKSAKEAYEYMKFTPGSSIKGTKIDVAFIGSCTNGRLSDLQEVAKYVKGKKVNPSVKALVVPGSQVVKKQAEELGLDKIFTEAGFIWRNAGCSMCLAMNSDKLIGDQVCASSSNRNFKGRQGSTTGRTILMSPLMVAKCAIAGELTC